MATAFFNNLTGKAGNAGNAISNALFGSANTTTMPTGQYPAGIQNYLDSLDSQPYMQQLLNQPKQTGLTLDQYKQGIAQGLNYGVPEIADAQDALKINKPKTGEEIDLAKQGQFNQYPLQAGLTTTPRQGGFLNDFTQGYKENYQNAFDPNNLAPQKKNFATRLGEGLGSVGRFIDSPLGRGLIAGGLTSALGYDNPLQEGLQAYIARENALNSDKLYRQALEQNGIDLSGIRGNVGSELYKNVSNGLYKTQSLQAKRDIAEAKDNVSRARMIMTALNNGTITPQEAQIQMANYGVTLNDVQESNNTKLLPYKQYAMQVAPQVALGNLGVAQGNLALRQAELPYDIAYKQAQVNSLQNKGGEGVKLTSQQKSNLNTYRKLKELKNIIEQTPNATGLWQGINPAQNKIDSSTKKGQEAIKTRAMVDNLYNQIRHDYTGAQFSPKEDREYRKSIPSSWDNANEIKAKIDAQLRLYETDPRLLGNIDTAALQTQTNQVNNTQIINRLKNAGYSDQKIQQYLQAKGLQ